MKTISIFMLLIYWSVIIFAPVLSNAQKVNNDNRNKIVNLSYKISK